MDEDVEVNCRTEMARSFPPEKDPTQATHQCRLPMMRPSSKPQSAIHELTFMPQYSASGAQQTSQAAVSALCGARRSIGNRRVHGSPSSRVQSTRNNIPSQDPYDSTPIARLKPARRHTCVGSTLASGGRRPFRACYEVLRDL